MSDKSIKYPSTMNMTSINSLFLCLCSFAIQSSVQMSMKGVGDPVQVIVNGQTELRVYSSSSSPFLPYKDLPKPMNVSTARVVAEEGSPPSTCFFYREPDMESVSTEVFTPLLRQPMQSRPILSEPFTTEEGPRSLTDDAAGQSFADATRIYCYPSADDAPLGRSFTVFAENADGQAVLERSYFTRDNDIFAYIPADTKGLDRAPFWARKNIVKLALVKDPSDYVPMAGDLPPGADPAAQARWVCLATFQQRGLPVSKGTFEKNKPFIAVRIPLDVDVISCAAWADIDII